MKLAIFKKEEEVGEIQDAEASEASEDREASVERKDLVALLRLPQLNIQNEMR